ncbi:hypothetical protein [Paenibacillus sp. Leaf72]|uniref:hypothetical protein n=1 Tax=Paenibacillus sp. Leaf72 TaxID=1736234 RepID=UPI0012DE72EF|nr:hypothetical protein [Paenibacillus sp. Leaf72]
MNLIKRRMARRQVKVIDFRLVHQLGRNHMHTAMNAAGFDIAAQLIQRSKGTRIISNAIFRSRIIARSAAYSIRDFRPRRNQPSVIALAVIPAVHTVNEVAVKTHKLITEPARRNGAGYYMMRMVPYGMLLEQRRGEIRD